MRHPITGGGATSTVEVGTAAERRSPGAASALAREPSGRRRAVVGRQRVTDR